MTEFTEEYLRSMMDSVRWWHRIELAPNIVTPGVSDKREWPDRMELPEDLSGCRVLDIGTYDGYFSFECERRGASVVAIDVDAVDRGAFGVARHLLRSEVEFRQASVFDVDRATLGSFDIVLFLGVIYHLRHPLLALESIHGVCKGTMFLESQVCDHWFVDRDGKVIGLAELDERLVDIPIAQFYPGAELNGDRSNWWSPNTTCLKSMIESSGFSARLTYTDGVRTFFQCGMLCRRR